MGMTTWPDVAFVGVVLLGIALIIAAIKSGDK